MQKDQQSENVKSEQKAFVYVSKHFLISSAIFPSLVTQVVEHTTFSWVSSGDISSLVRNDTGVAEQ